MHGIVKGILKKIDEFIHEGTIKRFEFIEQDEQTKVVELLEGVWGLGPKGALKLYKQGIHSIEELRERQDELLTDIQKIGLKYYEDFNQRIPREEVEKLLERVKEACMSEVKDNKNLSVEACGSYRRGKLNCGDIDILITKKDGSSIKGIIERVVERLEKEGFL